MHVIFLAILSESKFSLKITALCILAGVSPKFCCSLLFSKSSRGGLRWKYLVVVKTQKGVGCFGKAVGCHPTPPFLAKATTQYIFSCGLVAYSVILRNFLTLFGKRDRWKLLLPCAELEYYNKRWLPVFFGNQSKTQLVTRESGQTIRL